MGWLWIRRRPAPVRSPRLAFPADRRADRDEQRQEGGNGGDASADPEGQDGAVGLGKSYRDARPAETAYTGG